jgi:hypothetical protein
VLPSGQTRRAITQKSLSNGLMLGRECRRFKRDELLTQSKILEKETSPLAKRRTSIPKQSPTRLNMVKIYNRTAAVAMLLISPSAGVLATTPSSFISQSHCEPSGSFDAARHSIGSMNAAPRTSSESSFFVIAEGFTLGATRRVYRRTIPNALAVEVYLRFKPLDSYGLTKCHHRDICIPTRSGW